MESWTTELPQLGRVVVIPNARARRIIIHFKGEGLFVTVPPGTPHSRVHDLLLRETPRLVPRLKCATRSPLRPGFAFEGDCFKLAIRQGDGDRFLMRHSDEGLILLCPPGTDYDAPARQDWLHRTIEQAMRQRAQEIFPEWLGRLADRWGFRYRALHIKNSRSCWGSCSAAGNINLSLYLLLLPCHLIDYVMLHELCHTCEMSHSPRFWKLLDSVTDGNARRLRDECRRYRTDF